MHVFNRLKLSVCSRGIGQRLDRERGNRKGKKSKRPSFRFLQHLSLSLARVATKVSWLMSRVHYEKRLFALPSEQARDKLLDSRMAIEDIHMHANAFQKQFSNLLEELNAFVPTKWEVPPKEFSHSINDIPKPGSFGAKLFYNGLLMVSTRINAKNELDKRAQVHLAFLRGVFVRAAATPEQFEKLLNLSIDSKFVWELYKERRVQNISKEEKAALRVLTIWILRKEGKPLFREDTHADEVIKLLSKCIKQMLESKLKVYKTRERNIKQNVTNAVSEVPPVENEESETDYALDFMDGWSDLGKYE